MSLSLIGWVSNGVLVLSLVGWFVAAVGFRRLAVEIFGRRKGPARKLGLSVMRSFWPPVVIFGVLVLAILLNDHPPINPLVLGPLLLLPLQWYLLRKPIERAPAGAWLCDGDPGLTESSHANSVARVLNRWPNAPRPLSGRGAHNHGTSSHS